MSRDTEDVGGRDRKRNLLSRERLFKGGKKLEIGTGNVTPSREMGELD